MNQLKLTATIIETAPLRFTPAGVPVLEMRLAHQSEISENGIVRQVQLEMSAVLIGDTAPRWQAQQHQVVAIEGFLSCKSRYNRSIRLHITRIGAASDSNR